MPERFNYGNLDHLKISFVFDMFVSRADEDYLTARICYQNGLFHNFYWNTLQAIEKYGKANLLLNDIKTKNLKHDIEKILLDVRAIDRAGLIPEYLEFPKMAGVLADGWNGFSVADFVKHINVYGSPDNRYAYEGTDITVPLIHACDYTCFHIRRSLSKNNRYADNLAKILDEKFQVYRFPGDPEPVITWGISNGLKLERLFLGKLQAGEEKTLINYFSNANYPFFKKSSISDYIFNGLSYYGAPLHNYLVRLPIVAEGGIEKSVHEEFKDWIFTNVGINAKKLLRMGIQEKTR